MDALPLELYLLGFAGLAVFGLFLNKVVGPKRAAEYETNASREQAPGE